LLGQSVKPKNAIFLSASKQAKTLPRTIVNYFAFMPSAIYRAVKTKL
jgi:hypothetical protein